MNDARVLLPTPAMTGETSLRPWTPSTLHADTCSGIAEGACLAPWNPASPEGQTRHGLDARHGLSHGDDQGASSAPLGTSCQPHAGLRAKFH